MGLVRLSSDRNEQMHGRAMNCLFFAVLTQHVLATSAYFLFTAQKFREYAESFYYVCYTLQVFAWYTMHFLNRTKYAESFAELDAIVALSKCDSDWWKLSLPPNSLIKSKIIEFWFSFT